MTARSLLRRISTMAVATVAVLCVAVWAPSSEAGAMSRSGGGSGSAGAQGSGDTIVSSILWGGSSGKGGRAGGDGSPEPECRWHTLGDLELVFLLHVAANMPELGDVGLLAALAPLVEGGLSGAVEVQVLFCEGVPRTDQVRGRPAAVAPTDVATAARRRLLTVLPPPEVATWPPLGRPVVVNEPIMMAIDRTQWDATVAATLSAGGATVEVEARPRAFEALGGEADGGDRLLRCAGPGVAFDPLGAAPASQVAAPGACVLRYSKLTGVAGRRAQWTGYVMLRWDGRYRIDGGPWEPLGDLFSYRLTSRQVIATATAVEHP